MPVILNVEYLRREYALAELVKCATPGCPNETEAPSVYCQACKQARKMEGVRRRRIERAYEAVGEGARQ